MEWSLTFPPAFSLTQLLRRSRWFLLPPFEVMPGPEALARVEWLVSGRTVAVTLKAEPAGLSLSTEARLSGVETEDLSRKLWRALRLGEDLTPLLTLADAEPLLRPHLRQGVRLLRGTSPFEDGVKALLLACAPPPRGARQVAWLVEHLGHPLASNPTRHAFPTPRQILEANTTLAALPPALSQALSRLAERFFGDPEIAVLLDDPRLPLEALLRVMERFPGWDERARALWLLFLGRYDYIPTDECAVRRVSLAWYGGRPIGPAEVRAAFAPWQPWGGLIYWLWDWPPTYPREPWEGE